MSYTSESEIPKTAKLSHVQDVIALLGYKKVQDDLDVPNRIASYFRYEEADYQSWAGVELDIYREGDAIKITTRSGSCRSYWDLVQQNKTLKLIRDLFGGHFTTDAGRNRYWRPDEPPPSPLSSGCFLARWRFHNALGKAHIYLMNRVLEGPIAREAPSGLGYLDELNPRLLSNNFLLPYIVAVWEDYFRSTFVAALKYSNQRERALKKVRLSHTQLEQIALGTQPIERAVAESFSFQRPSLIAENFRLLDPKLNVGGAMRKPYKRRKTSLYDSIEDLIEGRNAFVHAGKIDMALYDKQLKTTLADIGVAVDRAYECIAKHYKFVSIHDY